jgi:hypothetical protein
MVGKLVVSAESLRNAEKAVEHLRIQLEKAGPAEKPAWQGRLDHAIRHLELLQHGTPYSPPRGQT